MLKHKFTLQKHIDVLFVFALLVIPFVNISKGLDYTDTGYSLMNFQNFLDPRGDWSLCMYFANFVGWLFLHFPGGRTLLGMRIYCTVIVSAMNLLTYRFYVKDVCKKEATYIQKTLICLGVCMATTLAWCPRMVLYNYLGYFFTSCVLMLLYRGLVQENGRFLLLAGILLALSTFTRLPNALQVLFILPVVVYGLLTKKKPFDILKDFYNCVVGYLSGFAILMVCSMLTHGYDAYVNMVSSMFALKNADYGYSGSDMFSSYPLALKTYGKWIGFFFLTAFIVWVISKRVKNVWVRRGAAVFGVGILAVLYKLMHYWGVITAKDFTRWEAMDYFALVLVFLTFLVSLLLWLNPKATSEDKFLSTFVLVYLLIMPIGTNTKYRGVYGALFIVLPFLFITLEKQLKKDGYKKYWPLTVMLFTFTFVSTFHFTMSYVIRVYGDMSSTELVSKESHVPALKGEMLLPGMVGIIDGLYDYLEEENLLDTKLLTWGDIPSVCFYTGTKSALSNAWPDLASYQEADFSRELDFVAKPTIVINRWFSGGDPLDPAVWEYSHKAQILATYMEMNGYTLTFENDKFRVYLPKK